MQIAQILSGYSLGEADLLRRAMGKKKKEEMDQQRERFVKGATARGVSAAKASHIFDLVAEFAGYGFNKSHAAAYAVIAYQTAVLKARRPAEFMAALMSLDIANTDKLALYFQEARRMGVAVRPPDVNASGADFTVEEGTVRYALGAIRNVGPAAMEHVCAVRAAGGPFKDLYDFAERVDSRHVNKRTFENLARAGAFDSIEPDRARAFAAAEILTRLAAQAAEERESAQSSLFGGPGEAGAGLEHPPLPAPDPWPSVRQLDEELAAVGFYLSGHPLDDQREALSARGVVFCADAQARVAEGVTAMRMCGMVRRKQERVSARNGERFAWVTLSDPSGEYEVFIPARLLAEVRDALEPGAAVVIAARIDDREEQLRYFADSLEALDAAPAPGGLRVRLTPEALPAVQDRLRRAASRGGEGVMGEVRLLLPAGPGVEAELRLPGRMPADAAVQAALKAVRGVETVEPL